MPPGWGIVAGGFSPGARLAVAGGTGDDIRVSDAEREAALKVLGEHAAIGRLTLDELEERSGKALAATPFSTASAPITNTDSGAPMRTNAAR